MSKLQKGEATLEACLSQEDTDPLMMSTSSPTVPVNALCCMARGLKITDEIKVANRLTLK